MRKGFELKAVLVCRMGSSRLPGKTLMPFGGKSLLAHIVARIEQGGISRADICVATSENNEDGPILAEAAKLGCENYIGSSANVSKRILGAANSADGFLLVLGDNPWIDPGQISEIIDLVKNNEHLDYVVSPTQELPQASWPSRLYPVGTRLQYIRTGFMLRALEAMDNKEVREHTSKLFVRLPDSASSHMLSPNDGWPADVLDGLNVSINTSDDYHRALTVLERIGPDAPCVDVTKTYLTMKNEA